MVATNGCGWIVEEYIQNIGWKQSPSFPDLYSTFEEAEEIRLKRLKGKREFRTYECLITE